MTQTLPQRETTTYQIRSLDPYQRQQLFVAMPAAARLAPDEQFTQMLPDARGVYGQRAPGSDAWIGDLPVGVWPPVPEPDVVPGMEHEPVVERRPTGFRSAHRRRLDRLAQGILIGAGVVTAVLIGLDLAALLVMGLPR